MATVRDLEEKKDKVPVQTVVMNETILSSDDVPELTDFQVGDKIEIKIKATVAEISHPQAQENVVKENEPGNYKLKLTSCDVLNASEEREEAAEMGVKMPTYRKIQSKRRGGMAA